MSSAGKNPFLDEDEVDDFEFLNHCPQGQSGYLLGEENNTGSGNNDWELKQRIILQEKKRIEDRMLQSTRSSLGMVHESEQVGIATAEELVRQREQLQNVEKNLDTINSTMRISQKHINSIKSMFGGLKSYFTGSNTSDVKKPGTEPSPTSEGGGLQNTIGNLKTTQKEFKEDLHPGLRTRGIVYEDEEDEADFSKPPQTAFSPSPRGSVHQFDDQLDKNLEDLSMGLGRLKGLAIGLNEEIEDHNTMLDRIYSKTDQADDTIEYQNRQIKRILKK